MLENHYIRSKATQKVAKVQSVIEEEILSSQQGNKNILCVFNFVARMERKKLENLLDGTEIGKRLKYVINFSRS